ncbi:phage tail length tape measure family protein [Azospirillum rugosum]|uniref:Bacteriophage tail tape measure N-terminal domain-containing protein n=1 Tax=Azospirillum rugosum TaxID=416170 RepID=A0ABS4SFS6_9PROT|nr:phage tail length tape measure family protein [Azospirillum rugosum]MBP2291049.1 hypothetical protein [Azospirillum rugosum]MDQ0524887.1 hypothetical protein [Azospirillum rugosum]
MSAYPDIAASLEQVRRQYDPTYAATAKFGDEVKRVTAALDAANATDEERTRILAAVAAALDPVVRAEREREQAAQQAAAADRRATEEAERRRHEMIEGARATQLAADAQRKWSEWAGASDRPGTSAAASAAVFQEAARAAEEQAQAQAALAESLEQVRRRYNPVYAEQVRLVEETNRVTRILEQANVAEEERAAILKEVTAAHDPLVRAENERAEALRRVQKQEEEATRALIERERATQRAATAQEEFNRLLGVQPANVARGSAAASASVFEDAQKDADALQRVIDSLDRGAAAKRRFAEAQATLDEALKRGAENGGIDEAQHTKLSQALRDQETAYFGAANGARAHSRALQVLVPQLSDIAVQAQAGTGALTILVQQGPQIAEGLAFAGKEALLAAGRFVAMAAPVLALAAGLSIVAYGVQRLNADMREFERVSALSGNAAGLTTEGFATMAKQIAATSDLSRASARDIATSYAGTGKIGAGVLAGLTAATHDWALATAQDTDKAAADLTKLFIDPSKGVDELTQRYGMFDDAQRRVIRNYVDQGNMERAQALLLKAIEDRAKGAADKLSAIERGWNNIKNFASNVVDKVAENAAEPSRATRIQRLEWSQAGWGNYLTDSGRQADAHELAALKAEESADAIKAWAESVRAEYVRLSNLAGDFARSLDPAITATEAFGNKQKLLADTVAAGAMPQREATRLIGLYKMQLLDAMDPVQAFTMEVERQTRVMDAHAGVARDYEQARQAELRRRGQKPGESLPQRTEDKLYEGAVAKSDATLRDRHTQMVEAAQDAQVLARATASLSPAAQVAAQATIEYNRVLRETKDPDKAKEARNDALAKGTAELTGRYKPGCYGRARQIEPVLINSALNIYMIDPLGYRAMLVGRDRADAFNAPGPDLASYAALAAQNMAGIDFATAKGAGLVRLAVKPAGRFTTDVEGVTADLTGSGTKAWLASVARAWSCAARSTSLAAAAAVRAVSS